MEEIKATKMNDGIYEFANLKGVTILLGFVKDIDNYPTKLEIPDNINFIWDCAFEMNNTIESVIIPKNVTGLGTGAFYNCTNLKEIKICGTDLTYFGTSCFEGCTNLQSIDLSSCRELSLLDYAFKDCNSLKEIQLPENIDCVYNNVFKNCTALKEIKFPKSIKHIYDNAFDGCTNIKIYVPKEVSDFKFDNNFNIEVIKY